MLTELCTELRNYFEVPNGRHFGKFEISGGSIAPLDFLQEGQYFRIVGSVFNDGVYKYPITGELQDETFDGAIWEMAVPNDFVLLCEEISKWKEQESSKPSPYVSESFGGYSYTKATNSKGMTATWKDAFLERLNRYRKVNVL